MGIYKKKPVEVEARKLTYENANEIANWVFKYADGTLKVHGIYKVCSMEIRTLEGTMKVEQGDWIIKGVKDEMYPVRADIFEETYEAIEKETNE